MARYGNAQERSSRTDYDAYGNERAIVASSARSPFRFAGGHGYASDDESGLDLLGARYYVPGLGRFLTQDPSGEQGGLNLYAYCMDNPLSKVDPTGLDGWTIGGYEFSGASVGKGLLVSGAALGHTLSFGLWDGGALKDEDGFAESSAAWTVASIVAPEGLSGLGLRALEKGVGHIAERHLAKSIAYLTARTVGRRAIQQASSFYSATVANALIRSAIRGDRAAIETWLYATDDAKHVIDVSANFVVGYGARQGGAKVALKGAKIILEKNAGGGFHVLTAFPQ